MTTEVVGTQLELLEISVWVIFTNLTLQNIIPGTQKSKMLTCFGDRFSESGEQCTRLCNKYCTQSGTVFVVGYQVGTRVAACALAADRRSELSHCFVHCVECCVAACALAADRRSELIALCVKGKKQVAVVEFYVFLFLFVKTTLVRIMLK